MNFLSKKFSNNYECMMGDPLKNINKFDDVINLSLGDPDLTTNKIIIDNTYQDTLNGATHYELPQGNEKLIEQIILFHKEEYDQELKPQEIMVTTSASHGMYLVLKAILNENDKVMIPSPFFSSYKDQVELNNGQCVFVNTYEKDNFELTLTELNKNYSSDVKALIINTPNNPTGAVYSYSTLKMIADFCIKHNMLVIADDIYTIFMEGKFVPISTFKELKDNVVTLRSFSKDYCMTGWRIGYIHGPSYIINCVKSINDVLVYSAPSISQHAAIHALINRKQIQPEIKNIIDERIKYCLSRIKSNSFLSSFDVKGSIYVFMNIQKSGMSSIEFANYIFEKLHIIVIPGTAFGELGEGYVRLAMTVDIKILKEAFDRLDSLEF